MSTMTLYNKRLLCRIVLEATTPLSIGSGLKDITTDSLVVKDINGLPYIPGT
ncbi:MAG: RAMP superfamily CRISPR-associated protein, partial [Tannerellaceae bacterium]